MYSVPDTKARKLWLVQVGWVALLSHRNSPYQLEWLNIAHLNVLPCTNINYTNIHVHILCQVEKARKYSSRVSHTILLAPQS